MEELCEFLSPCFEYLDLDNIGSCVANLGDCCGSINDFDCLYFHCPTCDPDCLSQLAQINFNPFESQCCSYVEADCLSSLRCYHTVEEVSNLIQSTCQALGSVLSSFSESISWMIPNNCLVSLGIDPDPQDSNQNREKFPSFSLLEEEISLKDVKKSSQDIIE